MTDTQKRELYNSLLSKLDRARELAQFIVDGAVAKSTQKAA